MGLKVKGVVLVVFELLQFDFNEAIRPIVVVNDVVFNTYWTNVACPTVNLFSITEPSGISAVKAPSVKGTTT